MALAGRATQGQTPSCVDVQAGSAESLACINQALRHKVQQAQPMPDNSTTTATSAPNRTGTFNQAATREFLGSSFGHSAIPQPHLHTVAAPPP
jgi:hypothetical protein